MDAGKLTETVKQENFTIAGIHRSYLKRTDTYVVLEDMDFCWSNADVKAFDHMWREGLSIADIAVAFDRDGDEVALLAMDRIRKNKVNERKGGAYGNRRDVV